MILKVLHQVWLGPDPPAHIREWCAHWKGMHPEWEYHLWRNDAFELYAADPYVRFLMAETEGDPKKMAFVVDRIRVLLLRDFGGVYLDSDCQPVRTLNSLDQVWNDPQVDFVCGMRSPDRKHVALHRGISLIDNTVFASAKGGRMINRICALYTPDSRKQNGYSQGLEIIRHADQTTRILNYRYFYAETPFPETVLLHDSQNLGSWTNRRQTVSP